MPWRKFFAKRRVLNINQWNAEHCILKGAIDVHQNSQYLTPEILESAMDVSQQFKLTILEAAIASKHTCVIHSILPHLPLHQSYLCYKKI